MQTLTVNQLVAREVKSAIGHADLRQKDLAQILGITTASISDKLKGKNAFSLEDLLVVAGALGLTLDELLGSSVTTAKVPAPTYTEDEKGKKKVVPVGFVPTGTTYQMVASSDKELSSVGPAGLEPATKGLHTPLWHQTVKMTLLLQQLLRPSSRDLKDEVN